MEPLQRTCKILLSKEPEERTQDTSFHDSVFAVSPLATIAITPIFILVLVLSSYS